MAQLEKLILKVCDEEGNIMGKNTQDGSPQDIQLMFNPEELTFTRAVKWEAGKGTEGSALLPKINFSGVEPYKLTLKQILFDTYESKESVMGEINNIRKGVEKCEKTKEKRPPVYLLTWGASNQYFYCVITSLTYKLSMFLADGTPVRALVDIALQEVEKGAFPKGKGSKSTSSNRANTAKNPPPPRATPVKRKAQVIERSKSKVIRKSK
jgi:Contractile injection system tube protein